MNSNDLYNVISSINLVRGLKVKKTMLSACPQLKDILLFAYSPYITYNIQPSIAWKSANGTGVFTRYTFDMLSDLASGELSGTNARKIVASELNRLSLNSARLLLCILNKSLDFGLGVKSINQVFPGLIPVHAVKLAKLYDKRKVVYPCLISPKVDGLRAIFKDGKFFSRNGHEFKGLSILEKATSQIACMFNGPLDGELIIDGEHFNEISGSIRAFAESDNACYKIFDYQDESTMTVERHRRLAACKYWPLGVEYLCHTMVNSPEEVESLTAEFMEQGYEGSVIKNCTSYSIDGRSYDWMKIKRILTDDCMIIGTFEGRGKYSGMVGGLYVDCDGVAVRVGSGLSDEQRRAWSISDRSIIGQIAEVAYQEKTPSGSLRHPRLVRLRGDK